MVRSKSKKKYKTKEKLKSEAWTALSNLLRAEIGKCERCGNTETLQVHHLIKRSKGNSVYFLRDNLVVLCKSCHFWVHTHATAKEELEMAYDIIGEPIYTQIDAVKNEKKDYCRYELIEMKEGWKNKLKELG